MSLLMFCIVVILTVTTMLVGIKLCSYLVERKARLARARRRSIELGIAARAARAEYELNRAAYTTREALLRVEREHNSSH